MFKPPWFRDGIVLDGITYSAEFQMRNKIRSKHPNYKSCTDVSIHRTVFKKLKRIQNIKTMQF